MVSAGRFRIRQATPADADAAVVTLDRIWQQAYPGLLPEAVLAAHAVRSRLDEQAELWRDLMAAGEYFWLVVDGESDDEIVGVANACIARDLDAPVALELASIHLLGVAHGTGIADRLLQVAVGDAPAYLWVLDGNERAIAFYRRHGFELDGGRKTRDDLGVAEVRMVRTQSPA
ncbi:N-acetyltransferase family protein [Propionibacteriaceae bacterium Y2011]|uniref:GNAT family N-acetyltransferase n=1 Tax=Microlunatus sp. Y2014 TaxID=3418488 RepID=UPI003B4BF10B